MLCLESDNVSHVVIGRRTSPIWNSVSPVDVRKIHRNKHTHRDKMKTREKDNEKLYHAHHTNSTINQITTSASADKHFIPPTTSIYIYFHFYIDSLRDFILYSTTQHYLPISV